MMFIQKIITFNVDEIETCLDFCCTIKFFLSRLIVLIERDELAPKLPLLQVYLFLTPPHIK